MTKVKIIGSEAKKKGTKIKFERRLVTCLDEPELWTLAIAKPEQFDSIELIRRGGSTNFDIMFAYNKGKRIDGILFLGCFNDGIV